MGAFAMENKITVERFNSNPLITPASSPTLGHNINGPSVIRVPDWVHNPLGKYYMYFAHHAGSYIRLAYADDVKGPWHIYEPGTLRLKDVAAFHNHIASPDVHIDDEAQLIRMYFHSPVKGKPGQWTGVANSKNGIQFNAEQNILGKFYFRVWQWQKHWYAIAKNNNEGWGELYRAEHYNGPFELNGNFLEGMRHAAIWVQDYKLKIFYTRVGDAPERILMSSVDMRPDWKQWKALEPVEILRPEEDYEGIQYPIITSIHGSAIRVRELRDPCVFTYKGEKIMFYCVGGEMGISGVELEVNMTSLKKANKLFRHQKYDEAYNLYLDAAKSIGYENVSFNLDLCKKRLGEISNTLSKENADKSILNKYFDCVYLVNLEHKVQDRLIAARHLSKAGVGFKLVRAVNGYEGEPLQKFNEYQKKTPGSMVRYAHYNYKERARNSLYIESAGAIGYIYTYLNILNDAKRNGYKRFLILEDDVILINSFEKRFDSFINSVNDDWKVLLFGASQYGWEGIDEKKAEVQGYYYPGRTKDSKVSTCGSFAIAFDLSVVDEVIDAQQAFEAPFDHFPMSELYKRHHGKCFVAYPNIAMPDVSESTIRNARDQYKHGEKMKWQVDKFDFPLNKPSISVIISDADNLKYFNGFSDKAVQPFDLRVFFYSKDGIRPLHNTETLSLDFNQNISYPKSMSQSLGSDYVVNLDESSVLTESDIINFIEYKTGVRCDNTTVLAEVDFKRPVITKDRVSVIIPTYKRPKNLSNALTSVIEQDYSDIEVIVVSDNGISSEYNEETALIVKKFEGVNPKCKIILINHIDNRNGAAARNTGILASTGEYICFLDDDDIYLPGRLSLSIDKLKVLPKKVGGVYCGFLGWNSPENDLNRYKEGDLTLEIFMLDYKKHYLHTNTATYRREAVMAINGFDESYRRHQDLEFNIRFFQLYEIRAIKYALARLNPEPSDVSNKVFNLEMVGLKKKFLAQFAKIICSFSEFEKEIYLKHWSEVSRYINDQDKVVNALSNDFKQGFYKVLIDKLSERK